MVQIMDFDIKTFSIHALELKLWLFKVCTGSHAFAMFAHKKNYGRVGYVDDPLQNIVYMAISCLVG